MPTGLLAELSALVLPVACAGCGVPDRRWCGRCAASLGPPVRCEHRAGRLDLLDGASPLPVWCVADFTGPVRRAVTAWKDRGRTDLGPRFATAMTEAAQAVCVREALGRSAGPDGLLVVGVPTSPAAVRRRGGDVVQDLVRGVVRGTEEYAVPVHAARPLRRASGVDSAGLGARARVRHLDGAVRLRRRWVGERWAARLVGARVVLVDDVLTTGATFAACRRVLVGAGAVVVAGLVLASTPAPRSDGRGSVVVDGVEVEGPGLAGIA